MSIDFERAREVLEHAGFEWLPPDDFLFRRSFLRAAPGDWRIFAHAGDAVTVGLVPLVGPRRIVGPERRFDTEVALNRDLPRVVAALEATAERDDELRCPVCKLGHIVVKHPTPRDTWEPFLSCSTYPQCRWKRDRAAVIVYA